jgi:hypothetical protein
MKKRIFEFGTKFPIFTATIFLSAGAVFAQTQSYVPATPLTQQLVWVGAGGYFTLPYDACVTFLNGSQTPWANLTTSSIPDSGGVVSGLDYCNYTALLTNQPDTYVVQEYVLCKMPNGTTNHEGYISSGLFPSGTTNFCGSYCPANSLITPLGCLCNGGTIASPAQTCEPTSGGNLVVNALAAAPYCEDCEKRAGDLKTRH